MRKLIILLVTVLPLIGFATEKPNSVQPVNKTEVKPLPLKKANTIENKSTTGSLKNAVTLKPEMKPALEKPSNKTSFLSLNKKMQLAGVNVAGSVDQPIRLDARTPYLSQYNAGLTGFNVTHDPGNNRYILRPTMHSGGGEAVRGFNLYWRAEANKRYVLDCTLSPISREPFVAIVNQWKPSSEQIARFPSPSNVTAVVGPFSTRQVVEMEIRLEKNSSDQSPQLIAVEIQGCEIQPL